MSRLSRCERGAIMVMALFMAVFATGCLYYVVGLADAIARRERVQDAADAAAFSAVVLHARGMNVIALINMTMAALLAILIALKLVELVCIVGVAIATGLAFLTGGGSLIAVPPLTSTGLLATEAYEQAQPVVHNTLRALRLAAHGVRIAIPWVAQTRTVQTVVAHYNPPATVGFAVPGSLTLPSDDGTYDDLCTKSGEYVGDLVDFGLSPIPVEGFSLGDLTSGLIDTGSAWFCGTEGAGPPSIERKRKSRLPVLPKAEACAAKAEERRTDRGAPSAELEAANADHEATCAAAEKEIEESDAAIDPDTGGCVNGADCDPDGLYEVRAARALEQCAPLAPGIPGTRDRYWWQAHTFKRRYVWDAEDKSWHIDALLVPGTEHYRLMKGYPRPCGPGGAIGEDWRAEPPRDGEAVPICDDIAMPTEPPLYDSNERVVEHTEVVRILRCREVVRERHTLSEGQGALDAGDDNDELAPQVIAAGAKLGEEPFQVRAIVLGEPAASSLGNVSAAQAELYFADAGADPSSYLWAMHWTARLRRFRLPEREPSALSATDLEDASANGVGDIVGSFEDACTAAGGSLCSDIDITLIDALIAH